MTTLSHEMALDRARQIVENAQTVRVPNGYSIEALEGVTPCGSGYAPDVTFIPKRLCGDQLLLFLAVGASGSRYRVDYDTITAALYLIACDQAFPFRQEDQGIITTNFYTLETNSYNDHPEISVLQLSWNGHESFCHYWISHRRFLDTKLLDKRHHTELDNTTFLNVVKERARLFKDFYHHDFLT